MSLTPEDREDLRGLGQGQVPAVVEQIVARHVAAALNAAADEIEAELVCCDAYERGDHRTRDQICYWGGASASLVRDRARNT